MKCQTEGPAIKLPCHCEERSDVAIRSLSDPFGVGRCKAPLRMRIATACGLAMPVVIGKLVLLFELVGIPTWSAWAVPHALRVITVP